VDLLLEKADMIQGSPREEEQNSKVLPKMQKSKGIRKAK
jgi:hypothetical protein